MAQDLPWYFNGPYQRTLSEFIFYALYKKGGLMSGSKMFWSRFFWTSFFFDKKCFGPNFFDQKQQQWQQPQPQL